MKQNTNIFVMIGLLALACGQLQGLTRRQFFKLDQLRQELNVRYRRGVPERDGDDWLEENKAIIEQIRQLDPPTAITYQKKQNIFVKKVEQHRAREKAEASFAQMRETRKEAERVAAEETESVAAAERMRMVAEKAAEEARKKEIAVQEIQARIQTVSKAISVQLAKSPDEYKEVNFSKVSADIGQISKAITDVQGQLTPTDFENLQNEANQLNRELADAIFNNLIKLALPIIKYINDMESYIERIKQSGDPFNFDRFEIKDSIDREINPRLDAAYQDGLLLDATIYNTVSSDTQKNARNTAKRITGQVRNVLDKLSAYIKQCNKISQSEKDDKKLSRDHFAGTVRAIKTMSDVINDLYAKLPGIFRNEDTKLLTNDLKIAIAMQGGELTTLKENLYIIYEVRRTAEDKIEILYYFPGSMFSSAGFYYFDLKKDPLAGIYPSVDMIKAKLPKRRLSVPSAEEEGEPSAEEEALRAIEEGFMG